jgi:hypothetical protein
MSLRRIAMMNRIEDVDQQEEGSRNVRRLAVAVTGISAAAVVVALKDPPESLAIMIGPFFTFLLVFRLADPSGHAN